MLPADKEKSGTSALGLYFVLALVVAVAALVRYLQYEAYVDYFIRTYGSNLDLDRIAESYHRWVIDILTAQRGGFYSDFAPQSNQAIYWLPFYNFVSAIGMFVTGNWSLTTCRIVSAVTGIITAGIVALTARRLYNNLWHSVIAGLVAGTLPWYVDYSLWGVPHALAAFLTAIAVYAFVSERPVLFGIAGGLAVATSYEAWVVVFAVALLASKYRGWVGRKAWQSIGPAVAVVALWSVWSVANVGNPSGWVLRYLATIGWRPILDLGDAGLYMFQLLVPTFFFGLVAVAWGVYKGQVTRILALAIVAFVAIATLFHVLTLDRGSPARLLIIYPMIGTLVPPVFPTFKGGLPRKTVLLGLLLIWLLLPQYALLDQEKGPLTGKAYIVAPEYRTGKALKEFYREGTIISDSPIVMYYSGLSPTLFFSSREIGWYRDDPDNSKLAEWLKARHVVLIVWEKSTSSELWQIMPSLSDGETHQLGRVRLNPVYEDTLAERSQIAQQGGRTLWEHDYPGTPDLIVYELQVA